MQVKIRLITVYVFRKVLIQPTCQKPRMWNRPHGIKKHLIFCLHTRLPSREIASQGRTKAALAQAFQNSTFNEEQTSQVLDHCVKYCPGISLSHD